MATFWNIYIYICANGIYIYIIYIIKKNIYIWCVCDLMQMKRVAARGLGGFEAKGFSPNLSLRQTYRLTQWFIELNFAA